MIKRLQELAQSRLGRLLAITIGLSVVSFLVYQSGPAQVWDAITRVPLMFLFVFIIELGVAGAENWSVVLTYGESRHKVPNREILRICLFAHSLVGVLPFGRAAGEAARAAMLGKYVGYPLAAASAARAQALSLLGNAAISIPCAIAVGVFLGPSWLLAAICAHFLMATTLGGGVLLAGKYTKLASRIGKRFRGGQEWGSQVDAHLATDMNMWSPFAWICLSRALRTIQRAVLLAAVGSSFGLLPSFVSEAINLVSSAIGDAIPAQVGVTEAGYALASKTLGLTSSDAIAMALLVHIAQVIVIGVGFLSPLLAPARAVTPEVVPPAVSNE